MSQELDKRYFILLAEDDFDDQHIASQALLMALPNTCLHIVNNGNEALEYLDQCKNLPDVLITDIQMPELTGLEVLKCLKAKSNLNHLPVVILSTSREPYDIQQAQLLGAALYITKPQLFSEWVKALAPIVRLFPDN